MADYQWTVKGEFAALEGDFRPLMQIYKALVLRGHPGYEEILNSMIYQYKRFAYARFRRLSRGGPEWPPLSPNTRKRFAKTNHRRVLEDTKALMMALKPISRDAMNFGTRKWPHSEGVIFGYDDTPHPSGRGRTFERLAFLHYAAVWTMPHRAIIVQPDSKTIRNIKKDAIRTAHKVIKSITGGRDA